MDIEKLYNRKVKSLFDSILFLLMIGICLIMGEIFIPFFNTTIYAENPGKFTLPDDIFPILPCDPQHGYFEPFIKERKWGLESIKDCNYTMAGFIRPEDIPECERLGLYGILISERGLIRAKEWLNFSDEEIDSIVKKMVDEANGSKAVIGFHLTDEPGASYFPPLAKAVRAVKKYAPGKLAYINVYPNYATLGAPDNSQMHTGSYQEYLDRYVAEINPQFISYDNYMVQFSLDMEDSTKAAKYYHNLLDIRELCLKHDLPMWNTLTACQIRAHTPIPSPANLHLQAYTTLAAGGRAMKWYTYYSRNYYGYAPIDKNDEKSLTWYYLQSLNKELLNLWPTLKHLKSTDVYFSSPAPVDQLPLLPGKLVRSVNSNTPVMTGEFEHKDGSKYIMIVNLSLEQSTKIEVKTIDNPIKIQIVSPANGMLQEIDEKSGLWLVAGQGIVLKLIN